MNENYNISKVGQNLNKNDIVDKEISKKIYQNIFENLNDLVFILNENFEFEYTNEDILLKLLEIKFNDLVGKSAFIYIHPEDEEKVNELFEVKSNSSVTISELRFKHKDGHWVWFESRGKSFYDKTGILKRVLISRNITERKMAEQRYLFIFENSPNAILLVDFKGIVIDSNKTSKILFGYDKTFLVDKPLATLTDIFPDQIKFYLKKIFKAFFSGKIPDPIELEIKNKAEEKVWVNLQASLLKIETDIMIQFIFQEITEKKKMELLELEFKVQLENKVETRTKELNDSLEQQQLLLDQIVKSSQFNTEFMATMSHELRTPLNAMIGFTDLLLEGAYGPLNKEQLEFMHDIKNSAENQFDMIQHILDISKIEAGQVTLNVQKFSLNSMVNQIKSSLKPLYNKKALKFKINGLDEEKDIYADPIRFKEILLNLLSNAVKFTISGTITLVVQERYDFWLFKVRDSGIGIATKDYDLVFKEFKRIDSTYVRSVPGTGLGLSLTKRLVNLHSGEITFFSVLGVGTTFTFSIPKKLEKL